MSTQHAGGRLVSLDALRAIAVLLVMGRHLQVPASLPPGILRFLTETWHRGGWVGVDLFFVLSGFLVSGLLFREHQRHGRVLVGRFLVRRGLKIYPAFYVFLFATLALQVHWHRIPRRSQILAEVFFVQNYIGGIWGHTWSLAVEEHFYLLISILVLFLARRGARRADPFSAFPWIAAALGIALLAARIITSLTLPYQHGTHLVPTHLRIDGLMLGVALAWAYHYRGEAFRASLMRHRLALTGLGILLLIPPFIWPLETTFAIPTFGFAAFALGSACLLGAGLAMPESWQARLDPIARIGSYSYSIYLWHLPMLQWGVPTIERFIGSPLPFPVRIVVFVGLSLTFGIGMARLIEYRVLRLRNRLFPSRSGDLPAPTSPRDGMLIEPRIIPVQETS